MGNSTKKVETEFLKALVLIESTKECSEFLTDLCTPSEMRALQERWRVAQLLDTGKSYRQINEETGVSTTTITRVARMLNDGNGYRKILDKGRDL